MRFLVYLYYTQPFYWTSTFGQNHAYCIRIFTVKDVYVRWHVSEQDKRPRTKTGRRAKRSYCNAEEIAQGE